MGATVVGTGGVQVSHQNVGCVGRSQKVVKFTSEKVLNMCKGGALTAVTSHPGRDAAPEGVQLGISVGDWPVGANKLYALLTMCKDQANGEAKSRVVCPRADATAAPAGTDDKELPPNSVALPKSFWVRVRRENRGFDKAARA